MLPMNSAMRCSFCRMSGGELLWRQMRDVFLARGFGIALIEIAVIRQQSQQRIFSRRDRSSSSLVPPRYHSLQIPRTGWARFGVVLPAFGHGCS